MGTCPLVRSEEHKQRHDKQMRRTALLLHARCRDVANYNICYRHSDIRALYEAIAERPVMLEDQDMAEAASARSECMKDGGRALRWPALSLDARGDDRVEARDVAAFCVQPTPRRHSQQAVGIVVSFRPHRDPVAPKRRFSRGGHACLGWSSIPVSHINFRIQPYLAKCVYKQC